MEALMNTLGMEGCVTCIVDYKEYGGTYVLPWLHCKSRYLNERGQTVRPTR